jgi:D-glycero-alpha-D-manno-heptose-7-phosphate kinase
MIISRTPFRVSFVGGGTDIREFYGKQAGAVVSCAIDKYMYICVSPNFHKKWKVSYSQTEYADSIGEIKHDIVRETLKLLDIKDPLDIVSISDMPGGSGIGSSSAYTVGLLNALFAYKRQTVTKEELAISACNIEIDLLKSPIGKQDQYASAMGGLNYIKFNCDDTVEVERINYPWEIYLTERLLLMFTGDTRQSGSVLTDVKKNISSKNLCMSQKANLARILTGELKSNCTPSTVAELMNVDWNLKKQMSDKVTNGKIDAIVQQALDYGAIGCKLLGAGAEGFMLFYCEKERQKELMDSFEGHTFVKFMIDNDGSEIIFRS